MPLWQPSPARSVQLSCAPSSSVMSYLSQRCAWQPQMHGPAYEQQRQGQKGQRSSHSWHMRYQRSSSCTSTGSRPLLSSVICFAFRRFVLQAATTNDIAHAPQDPDDTTRLAALESFRGDTGLQGLVAYIVQWTAEKVRPARFILRTAVQPGSHFSMQVVTCLNSSLLALDQCLDVMEAMLQNSSLFVEPYVR